MTSSGKIIRWSCTLRRRGSEELRRRQAFSMGKKRKRQDLAGGGGVEGSSSSATPSQAVVTAVSQGDKKKQKLPAPATKPADSMVGKASDPETPNKKRKKKKNKQKKRQAGEGEAQPPATSAAVASKGKAGGGVGASGGPSSSSTGGLSSLQAKFKQKLEGAQFRMINEMLYTTSGADALSSFKKDPNLFDVYHKGFREQVSKWPRNPLDDIIAWLRKRPQARVADLGCGEARLAASVPNKVHSFDLVARNSRVIACDIAKVPLPPSSVDVVVFCLSLMGTNMMDFITEAKRLLVDGGVIKIAEVRSRFEGQEGGINSFKKACEAMGLRCKQLDKGNKMFFMMEFVKEGQGSKAKTPVPEEEDRTEGVSKGGKPVFSAKACVYKRR